MRVFSYLLLLVPCLVLASFAWDGLASRKLYSCSDSMGPFDFIPPFIHPHTDDHYIAPVFVVWALWIALVLVALAAPAIVIAAVTRTVKVGTMEKHQS
jgi:hypothetical protein